MSPAGGGASTAAGAGIHRPDASKKFPTKTWWLNGFDLRKIKAGWVGNILPVWKQLKHQI